MSIPAPEKSITQLHEKPLGSAQQQQPISDESEVSDVAEVAEETNENLTSGLPFSKARCIALVATLTGASFLNSLTGSALVIILPTIGKDLAIPEARLQWILSAYSLTFGCFMLFWGRVADIYGKRLIFLCGSVWFAVTGLVNPFIPNEIAFDLFRGLQGLGAAAMVPTAIGILGTTFPPSKAKNYAISCYSAGAPVGAAFGNVIAGLIAHYSSWKWVFVVISLLAIAIIVAAWFTIPLPKHTAREDGASAKSSLDWLGAALITVGLLTLLFSLTEGNVVGWSTPWVPALLVVSLILVAAFVFWQSHLEKKGKLAPIMKVSNFRNPQFSAAMAIMALFFSSFNGFLVYATYFYQDFQGLSPLETTLRFLPNGIAGFLTALVVSQLISRVPTYLMLAIGNTCVSVAALLFAAPIPPETTYWAWGFPAMILSVFGADTTWPSLILFTSHALPQSDQALGGALVNSMGQIGRSISLAVATAIQTAVMARERGVEVQDAGKMENWDQATLLGLRAAEWWHFAVGITALIVVLGAFRGSGIIGKVERPAQKPGSVDEESQKAEDSGIKST